MLTFTILQPYPDKDKILLCLSSKNGIMNITYDDFTKVDLRSGTIVKAEIFLRAKKTAYKIWANFGSEKSCDRKIARTSYDLDSKYQGHIVNNALTTLAYRQ